MCSPILLTEERRPPRNGIDRWLRGAGQLDETHGQPHQTHPWYLVLWLTGVDYFSTLGYQPGIALLAAGALAPVATLFLVLVTLACALPVYSEVAKRSYAGQGSIAMLENLFHGWWGKFFTLALLGFAGTDFVITMTLSAADAAQHAIENPLLHPILGDHQMAITLVLLGLLAAVFLRGFKEAIGFATTVCLPYLLLTIVVLARCVFEVATQPSAIPQWQELLRLRGDWTQLMIAAAIVFPRLALGLSGFETGVSVMPLIRGSKDDEAGAIPEGRIRNTRKMLTAAAVIMSVFLTVSSFVTALLIPESAYREGGKASGRAIAYLAHEYLGSAFGTLYDVSTILILWFAGASALAGLLHLIPRYLPRFGMAPAWTLHPRPLILVLLAANVIVTVIFRASVEAQGGAYATGVLVLMLSAGVASAIALDKDAREKKSMTAWLHSRFAWVVAAVFGYTLVANVIERPDGIIIASCFIFLILAISGISRYQRATELRVTGIQFKDEASAAMWKTLCGKKVNLVPLRTNDHRMRAAKQAEIAEHYNMSRPLAFIHVTLARQSQRVPVARHSCA